MSGRAISRTGPAAPRTRPPSAGGGAAPRRELAVAVVAGAVAGGLALSAAGQTWARVTADRPAPLPPVSDLVTGGRVAPLTTAAGLLLLAAAVALVAVRGAGRAAVGLLVAAAGGALVWSGLRPLTGRLAADVAALSSVGGSPGVRVTTTVHPGWPVVTVVAGVLGVLVGLATVLRGRGWPGMGRRYERPAPAGAEVAGATTAATEEERAVAAWRALDRGEDPTDPESPPPPGPSGGGSTDGAF